MTTLSDERLAQGGARGDRRAFEAIFRRYHQDLYRFCLAMLGSPDDAQDALQNTMVKVLRALPGEKREIKLKPWLYRIARNEAIETLRGRRERLEPELEQVVPSAAPIAERAEDRDRLRRLFADLEQLPERQRGALVMRELSGLSFEEIARAFETSPATARQTVYEARLSLRQMEEGREMRCEAATHVLSEADGRSRRRRDLRAHLRECPECRAFAAAIDARRAEFAALTPLPLAAASGVLHGVLTGKAPGALAGGTAAGVGAGGGGGLGGIAAGGAGKVVASSAIVKSVAAVAVAGMVGVSAAGRAGLIDVPLAAHGKPGGAVPRSLAPPPRTGVGATAGGGSASTAHPAVSSARKAGAGKSEGASAASERAREVARGRSDPSDPSSPEQSNPRDESPAQSRSDSPPEGPAEAAGHGQHTTADKHGSPAQQHGPTAHSPPGHVPSEPAPTGEPGSTHPAPAHGASRPTPQEKAPPEPPKRGESEPQPEANQEPAQTESVEQPANGHHAPDGAGSHPLHP